MSPEEVLTRVRDGEWDWVNYCGKGREGKEREGLGEVLYKAD